MAIPKLRKGKDRQAAINAISTLITEAEKAYSTDPRKANRLTRKAWRIRLKNKARLPPHLKRSMCRKCQTIMIPSKTCTVRTRRGHVVIHCHRCKRITRVVYKND